MPPEVGRARTGANCCGAAVTEAARKQPQRIVKGVTFLTGAPHIDSIGAMRKVFFMNTVIAVSGPIEAMFRGFESGASTLWPQRVAVYARDRDIYASASTRPNKSFLLVMPVT